jgi:ornithine carbamoyltransferase
MFGKHFLSLTDYSSADLLRILQVAKQLKALQKAGKEHKWLKDKSLAMVFQKPSLRTRVSFEAGITQLGGYALNIRSEEMQMGKREPIADVARVLSRYVDAVMMRVIRHTDLVEFAKYSSAPVINGLSDLHHPCQSVSDMLTIEEHKGKLRGLTLCYIGDGNNVCNSLIEMGSLTEMKVVVCCPKGYDPLIEPKVIKYEIIRDPFQAACGADIVYTDVWTSMGQEKESMARLRAFSGYTITEAVFAKASPKAIFMHCLPAHRGEEVDDRVVECSRSVIFDQAENRLHAQKAVLALLLCKELPL